MESKNNLWLDIFYAGVSNMGKLLRTIGVIWTMKISTNFNHFLNKTFISITRLFLMIVIFLIVLFSDSYHISQNVIITYILWNCISSFAELLIHFFPFSFQNDIFGSLNDSSLLSRASEALVAVDMKHPVSASQASQLANAAGAIAAGHISSAASQAAFSQIKVLLIFWFIFKLLTHAIR